MLTGSSPLKVLQFKALSITKFWITSKKSMIEIKTAKK